MKNYFTSFHIYEVNAFCQKEDFFAYAVDSSIIGALCIAHENIDKKYEITKIKRAENNPTVIMPVKRISSNYKMFHAELQGEWNGQTLYIIAGSFTVAAVLLDEYCGGYYRVEKFSEVNANHLYVSPHNPEKLED